MDGKKVWGDPSYAVIGGVLKDGKSISVIMPYYHIMMVKIHADNVGAFRSLDAWIRKTFRLRQEEKMFSQVMHLKDANGCNVDPHAPRFRTFTWGQFSFKSEGDFRRVKRALCNYKRDPRSGWERVDPGPKRITFQNQESQVVEVVEHRIKPAQHFVQIHHTQPGGFVEIPRYRVNPLNNRATHSDLEVYCAWNPSRNSPFVPVERDENFPLTICSFDIEVHSDAKGWRNPQKTEFPNHQREGDHVIQFAATIWNSVTDARERVVFCLKETIVPPDMEAALVYRYDTEVELLESVRDWCVLRGVFIYTGYNIKEFDWWYMYKRMERLSPNSRFFYWGHVVRETCQIPKKKKCPVMPGCINIDLLPEFRRRLKLDTYSLNAVSKHALGKKKIDMPAARQFQLFDSGIPENRGLIAAYCLQDTYLPIELIKHYLLVEDLLELSKVTRVFTDDLLSKGQMFRVVSLLFVKLRENQFALSNLDFVNSDGYKGATVLDVTPGFYHNLTVLDFEALYPSIIRAMNLCFCTLVKPDQPRYPHMQYRSVDTDLGELTFAQNLPGILPMVCKDLLDARGRAKKKLKWAKRMAKEAKTPDERKKYQELAGVFNARQLNLKIVCNSIYGFCGTGANMNDWSCLEVSAATTAVGRNLIFKCQEWAENDFKTCGSRVIGGDTDSIFVLFDLPANQEGFLRSFELATAMAEKITERFRKLVGSTINLEFEKVYKRVLMFQKKCRVAIAYETPEQKEPKMDAKGVAGVRRSFCIFQRNIFWEVVKAILLELDVSKSLRIMEDRLKALCEHKVPTEELILTCNLAAKYATPENAVAWVIASKIEERQPGYRPTPGTRVSYFPICGRASAKVAQKVDDAEYIQEQKLESKIDLSEYIRKLENTFQTVYMPFPSETKRTAARVISRYYTQAYNESYNLTTVDDFFKCTTMSSAAPVASVAPVAPSPAPSPKPMTKKEPMTFGGRRLPPPRTKNKTKNKKRKTASKVRTTVTF